MKQLVYIVCFLLFLTGCSSSQKLSKQQESESAALVQSANRHIGTRYVYGGSTPKGFDCSGFVHYIYKEKGYSLPRTSKEQAAVGKKVDKKNLRQGDLVFFKGSNKKNKNVGHVGIVTEVTRGGKFNFVHVASSSGVRTDNSENTYWKPRYIKARRVIGVVR